MACSINRTRAGLRPNNKQIVEVSSQHGLRECFQSISGLQSRRDAALLEQEHPSHFVMEQHRNLVVPNEKPPADPSETLEPEKEAVRFSASQVTDSRWIGRKPAVTTCQSVVLSCHQSVEGEVGSRARREGRDD
ncbi:hypothetical protein chiPu_0025210 [Chiloscyllium punctatum]|uniref:Uncharacterized protein n=1 Tax=Chiloscyllium punctatum TaxID=137246 RepID=A0A401TF21_CHIPU|nr:hypothetical protein [Chiloscyllium punctatum]